MCPLFSQATGFKPDHDPRDVKRWSGGYKRICSASKLSIGAPGPAIPRVIFVGL